MKAQDMVDNDYCAHLSPTYGYPAEMTRRYAPDVAFVAENLSAGQKDSKEVFTAWLASNGGHKEVMLNKTPNRIGVGVAQDENGRLFWILITGKEN
jgi:uncharacterized protein YkwD